MSTRLLFCSASSHVVLTRISPPGQFVIPTAYSKNVEGIISPVVFFWNVEKK